MNIVSVIQVYLYKLVNIIHNIIYIASSSTEAIAYRNVGDRSGVAQPEREFGLMSGRVSGLVSGHWSGRVSGYVSGLVSGHWSGLVIYRGQHVRIPAVATPSYRSIPEMGIIRPFDRPRQG